MLNVDIFFYEALKANEDLNTMCDGRIFNTARTTEDEDEDKTPYCIIMYEGGSADGGTKDDVYNDLNTATISILACADSRDELATLTSLVNEAVKDAINDGDIYDEHDEWDFYIADCVPSAGSVQYDMLKPCHYQTLTFVCDTVTR